jgi:transcriptional regulator with XRE-family HTH domain
MKGVLLMSNNESIKAIFKDNLNKLLIEKDVTQKALADFVGVSTATVSDWKKGKKMPLMDKIDKICMFFHVDRSELLSTFDATNSDAVFAYAAGRPSSLHKIPPSRVLHNTGYVRNGFRHDHNPQAPKQDPLENIEKNMQKILAAISNERPQPTITEEEQALLEAYHKAPENIRQIVDISLAPYRSVERVDMPKPNQMFDAIDSLISKYIDISIEWNPFDDKQNEGDFVWFFNQPFEDEPELALTWNGNPAVQVWPLEELYKKLLPIIQAEPPTQRKMLSQFINARFKMWLFPNKMPEVGARFHWPCK